MSGRTAEMRPVEAEDLGPSLEDCLALEVFDTETGRRIGSVENIRDFGLTLIGPEKIQPRVALDLSLVLPEPMAGRRMVRVYVKSLWRNWDRPTAMHRSGCCYLVKADSDLKALAQYRRLTQEFK